MSEIKAIETRYKGYRFRSRLEARWAVFFETLGIEWQYEAEGYHLRSGPYLPDFFLPLLELHVEIKGTEEAARAAHEMLSNFRDEIGPILLFTGPPEVPSIGWNHYTLRGAGTLYCGDLTDSTGGTGEFDAFVGLDADREPLLVAATGRNDRVLFTDGSFTQELKHCLCLGSAPENIDTAQRWQFEDAVVAARSARFEYGEMPR